MAKKLKWDGSDEVVTKYAIKDSHGTNINVSNLQDQINNKADKVSGSSLVPDSKVAAYDEHIANKSNPHEVTKTQVGLGQVVNTGDSATPVQNGQDKFTNGGAYELQTELQEQITELKGIGRFLSLWNASTGVATSNPPVSPYVYKTGDYFRVSNGGNRIPSGSSYVIGGTNYSIGQVALGVGDVVYYDGTNWQYQTAAGSGGNVVDVQVYGVSAVSQGIANITNLVQQISVSLTSSSTIADFAALLPKNRPVVVTITGITQRGTYSTYCTYDGSTYGFEMERFGVDYWAGGERYRIANVSGSEIVDNLLQINSPAYQPYAEKKQLSYAFDVTVTTTIKDLFDNGVLGGVKIVLLQRATGVSDTDFKYPGYYLVYISYDTTSQKYYFEFERFAGGDNSARTRWTGNADASVTLDSILTLDNEYYTPYATTKSLELNYNTSGKTLADLQTYSNGRACIFNFYNNTNNGYYIGFINKIESAYNFEFERFAGGDINSAQRWRGVGVDGTLTIEQVLTVGNSYYQPYLTSKTGVQISYCSVGSKTIADIYTEFFQFDNGKPKYIEFWNSNDSGVTGRYFGYMQKSDNKYYLDFEMLSASKTNTGIRFVGSELVGTETFGQVFNKSSIYYNPVATTKNLEINWESFNQSTNTLQDLFEFLGSRRWATAIVEFPPMMVAKVTITQGVTTGTFNFEFEKEIGGSVADSVARWVGINVAGTTKIADIAISTSSYYKPYITPITTEGDMIIGGANGNPTRIPKGNIGSGLVVDINGNVVWKDRRLYLHIIQFSIEPETNVQYKYTFQFYSYYPAQCTSKADVGKLLNVPLHSANGIYPLFTCLSETNYPGTVRIYKKIVSSVTTYHFELTEHNSHNVIDDDVTFISDTVIETKDTFQ